MEDERDDEAAEVEQDYQDQEEEQDDEAEDTQSIKTYVKGIIPFDDDYDRNPHATSSQKGNIQLCFIFLSHVMLAIIKYNAFYLCRLHIFAN